MLDRPITLRDLLFAGALVLLAASPPIGNGAAGVATTCDETTIDCNGGAPVNLLTTQPNANTWTLAQTLTAGATANGALQANNFLNVNYNASTAGCGGIASAVTTPACVSTTALIGLDLNPGTFTAGSAIASPELCFTSTGASNVRTGCFQEASNGAMHLNNGGTFISFDTSSTDLSVGTGNLTEGKNFQGAACALSAAGTMPAGTHACKLTFTGITSMLVTFNTGKAYTTQAVCFAQDETTTNGAKVTACGTTTATVTATASDIVDFYVTGF